MNDERRFEVLWNQHEFEVPDALIDRCIYAQQFEPWVRQVIAEVEKAPTLAAVNVVLLYLLHKYFEWRVVVPKNHRNRIGETGHVCIFHVFEAGYTKLRAIQLSLQPPPLLVPPSPSSPALPPTPPPLQIAGIFLGEEE